MTEEEVSRPLQVGRFKDARGKSITLLDPYAMHLLRRHDVIPREALRKIADEVVGLGLPKAWRYGFRIWLLIAAPFVLGVCGYLLFAGTSRALLYQMPGIVLALVAIWGFWYGPRQRRLKGVRDIMLSHLRCPHCGYDLRMLPTDPDNGATVCPECGCAWRMDYTQTSGGQDSG